MDPPEGRDSISPTATPGIVTSAVASRRIAVTGARGFVASRLIPRLLARGDRVVAVLRPGRDPSSFGPEVETRYADLVRLERGTGVFDGAEAVVHLSGMSQTPGLIPALESASVSRLVFVSSAGVHTRLVSPGADAKRAGEASLRAASLGFTILRPSMIYGTPQDRNVVRLLRWIDRFPVLPLPAAGRTPQQPVHVDDLTDAILASLDRTAAVRQEYDVGGPEPITLKAMVEACANALGRRILTFSIPLGGTHRLVHFARRVGLPTPITPEQVLRLGESKAVDISAAMRDLDFRPRTFEVGIAEEVRLLRRAGRHSD